MSYCPPYVNNSALSAGTHECFLVDIKEITDPNKLAKFSAQAVFVATYKSIEKAIEIDHIIKFSGAKADFYAGQNIERLHLAAGLPEPLAGDPLDLQALKDALAGRTFNVEVNYKGYANNILIIGEDEAF